MKLRLYAEQAAGWLFGALLFFIGFVNTFWGNDPFLGIGIMFLSFLYYPPINMLIKDLTGITIPRIAKIILGVLLLWIALGVGELFGKIGLMMQDL